MFPQGTRYPLGQYMENQFGAMEEDTRDFSMGYIGG
jgi:hypothetical protein